MRFFLFLFCLPVVAQTDIEWYPLGSTYCYEGINQGYSVERDTIIENKSCKILDVLSVSPLVTVEEIILSENGGVVELFWKGLFFKVFDFNAEVGETIHVLENFDLSVYSDEELESFPFINVHANPNFIPEVLSLSYTVLEIGTLEIDGVERRYQNTDHAGSFIYEWQFGGIVEGLGSIYVGLLGGPYSPALPDPPVYPFSMFTSYCIEEQGYSFVSGFSWWGIQDTYTISYEECDNAFCPEPTFSYSENPKQENVELLIENGRLQLLTNSPSSFSLTFYDLQGRVVLRKEEQYSYDKLSLSNLSSGCFIAHIVNRETGKSFSVKLLNP